MAGFYGPIPPPSILGDYNDVVENGAERIMRAWESETAHRRTIESRDLWLAGANEIGGKVAALIFVLAALAVSAYAARIEAEWFATILGSGTIASVV